MILTAGAVYCVAIVTIYRYVNVEDENDRNEDTLEQLERPRSDIPTPPHDYQY